MARPAVSVIIPTYNRARFVTEAAVSVLQQSHRDFELIVYDDGSTDETAGRLDALRRLHPGTPLRCVRGGTNKGVSHARNRAVEASGGVYVAFLDSDDLWHRHKLRDQLAFMGAAGAAVCQTDEVWIRRGRRVNPMQKHAKPSGEAFSRSLDLCVISPSAVMMTRQLFDDAGGFDESFPACEDYDLWLRITARHQVPLLPKRLVVKRGGHHDQLSTTVPHLDRHRINAIVKLLDAGGISDEQRCLAVAALREKCRIYAAGLDKHGRHDEATRYGQLPERYID